MIYQCRFFGHITTTNPHRGFGSGRASGFRQDLDGCFVHIDQWARTKMVFQQFQQRPAALCHFHRPLHMAARGISLGRHNDHHKGYVQIEVYCRKLHSKFESNLHFLAPVHLFTIEHLHFCYPVANKIYMPQIHQESKLFFQRTFYY